MWEFTGMVTSVVQLSSLHCILTVTETCANMHILELADSQCFVIEKQLWMMFLLDFLFTWLKSKCNYFPLLKPGNRNSVSFCK